MIVESPRFGRVITAMVTPFDDAGALDLDRCRELARYLVDTGSDGLVLAGSTGEGFALSDSEKLDLFAAVSEAVRVPVLAGTSSSDTARSVELTAKASTTGVAGILATTPAYARPSQHGLMAHLGAMADATSLPVMLYDIPSRTGRKIAAETTIKLVTHHTNVVATKDASGDLPAAAHYKSVLGAAIDLYSGDDSWLLPFLSIGAVGIVSVASHWAGPEFAAIVDAVLKDDWERARVLNEVLAESYSFESSEAYPNPLPAKSAMRALGLAVGQCRLPMGPSDESLDARASDVLARLRAHRG